MSEDKISPFEKYPDPAPNGTTKDKDKDAEKEYQEQYSALTRHFIKEAIKKALLPHLSRIAVFTLNYFIVVIFSMFSIIIYHKILPGYWHWLPQNQLSNLESIVFSAALSALLTNYMKALSKA